ncbi:MAG: phosphoenolpyruvate synthase [candidate division WS6 bacterium 34_10]|uniref:Phosphoenolpyruvate synthase n=1 Tax=candidate division WS6 bacterium 34_10 TaxID=1641389 RepID=A0A101HGC1_9BACT|nr:MAG: phosphoenolpyruvate synthase [candidate division WS6 bacterium 34_10]
MSKSESKTSVYFWEDHLSKNLRESSVGRKGLSLFRLKDMDIPVPEFFVVDSSVYKDIVFESLDRDIDKLTEKKKNPEEEEVEKSILKTNFSDELIDEIKTSYTRISGFTDSWVSVRSSVVFPSRKDVSFSGVFTTLLNVRHIDDLLEAIKKVYASVLTDDVVMYAANKDIDLSEVKVAVVVQKMVQAEVSGVAFTVDPITQDKSKMSIEAVYGLGDVISSGEITPDTYVLNKKDLSVVEKHISPQEWMRVRTVGSKKKRNSVEKISISPTWSHRQKLDERHLEEVAKIALVIENKSREIQNVEWVQAGGRIWILQNKSLDKEFKAPEVSIVREDRDTLREVVIAFVERYRDIGKIEGRAVNEAKKIVQKQQKEQNKELEKLIKVAKSIDRSSKKSETRVQTRDDFLVSGIGASFGAVTGKVKIVENAKEDIKVTKNDVLVVKAYASEMESMILSAGAVITDTGGLTSDIAILCREFDIPTVVGAKDASKKLKEGDLVRVDGNTGTVYKETDPNIVKEIKEKKEEVHPVVEAYSSGEIEKEKEVEEEKEEEEKEPIPRDNSLSPTATKVFVMPTLENKKLREYVGNSNGIAYLDLDKLMIDEGRHLLAYVEDKKFVEYANSISEKACEIIELAQGDEVIVTIGSRTVKEFRDITKGSLMEDSEMSDNQFGLSHYLNNPEFLRRTLKIVKRIRDLYKKRNVSLGVHAPMSVENMREFKKTLSSIGLRRSSSFNVYAVIDNPTEVILVDEIVKAKIDGVVLNMPRIAKQMQGISLDDKKSTYSLSNKSILKVVDGVVDILKPSKSRITVICEDDEKLVAECVQKGVYGVSVEPKKVVEIRKLVAKEEAELILSK